MWLLQDSVLQAITQSVTLSDDQKAEAMAAIGGPRADAERVMVKSGSHATINVVGVMTSTPSWMAYFFGGGNTLYGDIRAAIQDAESDPEVKEVDFYFNSGGGEAQPVTAVGDLIAAMGKPTRAIVDTAASAAYWLASQTDNIVMRDRASQVGSIGVVRTQVKPSESAYIEVTSTNAPNKRPNPETEEGLAVIRAEIDPMHDLFATAVAVGRDTTVEMVNNNFGRGGMVLATKAIEVGMADGFLTASETPKPVTTKAEGAKIMDLATLKAEHPGLVAQIRDEGYEAGKKDGAAAEEKRVKFHAMMGEKTGATAFALTAIKNGTPTDDVEAQVEYMTCGRNGSDLAARQEDEAALAGNNPAEATDEAREQAAVKNVFDIASGSLGFSMEG